MTDNEMLTITLTDAAPIRVRKADWPVIASCKDFDGEIEVQANRTWRITVRRHVDGRAIVYGVHVTDFQNERGVRAGELVPAAMVDPDAYCKQHGTPRATCDSDHPPADNMDGIVHAIRNVCEAIGADSHVASECIADLPALELA